MQVNSWETYGWFYWKNYRSLAVPFFIGNISRSRTVRQTILGGYVFGVSSTLTSFIILGNYSIGIQMTRAKDFIVEYTKTGEFIWNDCFYYKNTVMCTSNYGCDINYDDCILCHVF